jgi:penicillin-binding protein 1B
MTRLTRILLWRPTTTVAAGLATLVVVALGVYSAIELARFERAEIRRAVFVYSAGQELERNVSVRATDLAGTLARLGYVETTTRPTAPGRFRRTREAWDIFLRDSRSLVHLDVRDGRIARVTRDGADVDGAVLDGEVLTGGGDQPGDEYRPIRLADAPKVLVHAMLAAEDNRFYEHGALDLRGLVRAVWANLHAGRVTQGGSTITQQLVKNRLLTPRRTIGRKLSEAWLAILIESWYSKDRILEAYLNEIYLGQRGPLAIRGVGAAARVYFGKEVHQLTAAQAALLAGMVRAPNAYSPALYPRRARARRDSVLGRMRALGWLDDSGYLRARREPVRVLARPAPGQPAPYFGDYVRRDLEERFGQMAPRVVTTLDPVLQRFAENAVAGGLDRIETRHPRLRRRDPRARLQVALLAVDPATGGIRAFVGGRDYQLSQFDRVTLARRQPGSAFKPFVYLAALRPRAGVAPFTAATMVDDAPVTVMVDGAAWSPRNAGDRYEGRVSVRRAFEDSLNAATVRIAQATGLATIVETARTLGFEAPLSPVPAMALGAFEVTPLDLARAYVPLANGGVRPGPIHAVRALLAADGAPLPPARAESPAPVVSPAEAYLMTSLLEGVVRSGTGVSARALGVPDGVAGKTGTTNDGRDAWFVGYSSRLLAVVWVGFDGHEPLGLSGAEAALPIWAEFMRQALAAYPAPAFAVPPGIAVAAIDPTNGRLAGPYCPVVAREVFIAGTEPDPCDEHRGSSGGFLDWWRRLRRWFTR